MKSTKRKIGRPIFSNFPIDILASNFLDKDVQSMLLPLNLMQILSLNPKYNIKNNFINPNNISDKFILLCGIVIFLTSNVYRIVEILLDDNMKRYIRIEFLYFASCLDFSFFCLGFITNFIINFIRTKETVKFILIFQEVHRYLHNQARVKLFILRTWFCIGLLFGYYVLVIFYEYLMYLNPPWNVTFNLVIQITLDFNLIYAMRLIKLLTDKVDLWNRKLLLSHKNGSNKRRCKIMFQAYVQIMKCYKIYKNIFQQSVRTCY